MDLLLFSLFLLSIAPSAMSSTLCCNYLLTSHRALGKSTAGHKDLSALAGSISPKGPWLMFVLLAPLDRLTSTWYSCLFAVLLTSIKFSCISASDDCSSFHLPRLFHLYLAQSQGSRCSQTGSKRATRPLIGSMSSATTPTTTQSSTGGLPDHDKKPFNCSNKGLDMLMHFYSHL